MYRDGSEDDDRARQGATSQDLGTPQTLRLLRHPCSRLRAATGPAPDVGPGTPGVAAVADSVFAITPALAALVGIKPAGTATHFLKFAKRFFASVLHEAVT